MECHWHLESFAGKDIMFIVMVSFSSLPKIYLGAFLCLLTHF